GRRAAHVENQADSLGNPVLARPIQDASTGQEKVLVGSAPGQFGSPGDFALSTSTEMWGAEGKGCLPVVGKKGLLVGFLGGFRYLNLEESLNISQNSGVLPGGVGFYSGVPVPPGVVLGVADGFDTQNNFYGGQLGAQAVGRWGPVALS